MATTIEQRRANAKKYRERWYSGTLSHQLDQRPEIPARVLAERDQNRASMPTNLTSALMGDPLPGRSALDKQ